MIQMKKFLSSKVIPAIALMALSANAQIATSNFGVLTISGKILQGPTELSPVSTNTTHSKKATNVLVKSSAKLTTITLDTAYLLDLLGLSLSNSFTGDTLAIDSSNHIWVAAKNGKTLFTNDVSSVLTLEYATNYTVESGAEADTTTVGESTKPTGTNTVFTTNTVVTNTVVLATNSATNIAAVSTNIVVLENGTNTTSTSTLITNGTSYYFTNASTTNESYSYAVTNTTETNAVTFTTTTNTGTSTATYTSYLNLKYRDTYHAITFRIGGAGTYAVDYNIGAKTASESLSVSGASGFGVILGTNSIITTTSITGSPKGPGE
jgi:hypothetical protein